MVIPWGAHHPMGSRTSSGDNGAICGTCGSTCVTGVPATCQGIYEGPKSQHPKMAWLMMAIVSLCLLYIVSPRISKSGPYMPIPGLQICCR